MGRNPVVEALRAEVPATALYVQAKADADDRWREALRLAVARSIPLMEVARPELDRMTDGGVHQGLVLTVPEYKYADADDFLDRGIDERRAAFEKAYRGTKTQAVEVDGGGEPEPPCGHAAHGAGARPRWAGGSRRCNPRWRL